MLTERCQVTSSRALVMPRLTLGGPTNSVYPNDNSESRVSLDDDVTTLATV